MEVVEQPGPRRGEEWFADLARAVLISEGHRALDQREADVASPTWRTARPSRPAHEVPPSGEAMSSDGTYTARHAYVPSERYPRMTPPRPLTENKNTGGVPTGA